MVETRTISPNLRWSVGASIVLWGMTSPGAAWAQSADAARAVELFHEGRAALEEKNYGIACPKLSDSVRLDPHVGNAISVAECEEATQRLAAARVHWELAVELARKLGDERVTFAEKHLAAVDPRVPRLTVRLPADADQGAVVKSDDEVVSLANIGVAMPVEIGPHVITLTSAGRDPWSVTVDLNEGEQREVLMQLGLVVAPSPNALVTLPTLQTGPEVREAAAPVRPPPSPVGYVAGGLGLAGLAVGTIAGSLAMSSYGRAKDLCPPHQGCSDEAISARNQAGTDAWVADFGLAVGVVGVAVGVYYLFLAPRGGPSNELRSVGRDLVVTF